MTTLIFTIPVESKTVLITGSNRGIGLEFTNQYAQMGWNVIASSRTPEDDEELIKLSRELVCEDKEVFISSNLELSSLLFFFSKER